MWEFNTNISDNETKNSSFDFYLTAAQNFVQTSMTLTTSSQHLYGDTSLCMRNIDNCTKNYTKVIKESQLISGYNNRCGCIQCNAQIQW